MLEQTFFPSFYEQTIFFTQLTEQKPYHPIQLDFLPLYISIWIFSISFIYLKI